MHNDAIHGKMCDVPTNVREKGLNMGNYICGALLNDLHRGLKKWKTQIDLWLSQQDLSTIHAWIQVVRTQAEQTTVWHTFEYGLSVDHGDGGMKQLAYIQRDYVITTISKAGDDFRAGNITCIIFLDSWPPWLSWLSIKRLSWLCISELSQAVACEPAVIVTENGLFRNHSMRNMKCNRRSTWQRSHNFGFESEYINLLASDCWPAVKMYL